MFGPGEYVPDPTEGIVDVNDWPQPMVVPDDRTYDHSPGPRCGPLASRHKAGQRPWHDLGDVKTGRAIARLVIYSSHYGGNCRKYFNPALSALAVPGSHYTRRVMELAGRFVAEDGLPYRPASGPLWRDHRVFVPFGPLQNWVEAGGKNGPQAARRRVSRLGPCVICGRCRGRCTLRGSRLCAVGRRQSLRQTDAFCGARSRPHA